MKKIYKVLFSIFITLLTLYFLFKGIRLEEIKNNFIFSPIILLITILLFGIIKLTNTLRFAKNYNIKPSKELFSNLCISNMFLSILPFRLGEISYLKNLKKLIGENYTNIGLKLAKIRLFDYLSISILLLISSFFVYNKFSSIVNLISIFFISSLFVGTLLCLLFIKLNMTNRIKIKKIQGVLISIENEIRSFNMKNLIFLLSISIISLIYWSLRLFMGYLVLNLLGINLSFFTISFISLAVFILSLIPLHFVAGFGITEGGFLFFLTQLGFSYEETLIKLFVYHIYIIIPVVAYGGASYLFKLKKHISCIQAK
jgi:hypothetical protein